MASFQNPSLRPTPIQAQVWPVACQSLDVIGIAARMQRGEVFFSRRVQWCSMCDWKERGERWGIEGLSKRVCFVHIAAKLRGCMRMVSFSTGLDHTRLWFTLKRADVSVTFPCTKCLLAVMSPASKKPSFAELSSVLCELASAPRHARVPARLWHTSTLPTSGDSVSTI